MIERFDIEIAKAVMLYISRKIEKTDIMRLFKILYFAEKKHLVKWGGLIVNDTYIAMKNGPVPSIIYDLFKGIRGDSFRDKKYDIFYNAFKIDGVYNVIPLESPDMDCLSKSNINSLDESIQENKNIGFNKLSKNSHDFAWRSADKNDKINFIDIAKAGGASEEMIDYILEERELSEILGCV
jgi:uncharacterized phage-associated protein